MEQAGALKKTSSLRKYLALCLILFGYFGYLNLKYDFQTSGVVALLTWSFFVLCTPVADAGFLLDFPLRLLFGFRMILSEILVWTLAISISALSLFFEPSVFSKTALTEIYYLILTHPIPYWLVILLSGMGTFLSLFFGDEILDHLSLMRHSKKKYTRAEKFKLILIGLIFFLVLASYAKLIAMLGMENFFIK